MILLNGKELAEKIKNQIKQELQEFLNKGYRRPTLAVILVGENPASQIYVNKKIKDCQSVGINSKPFFLPENITQIELLDLIGQLNGDEEVDGIFSSAPSSFSYKHFRDNRS